ncbi:CHAT domain-containing protein [Asticcacaulis benevestitus]|uniref:CHAT domain-containing protein n=1 Tax=Asticcacaulis benevestitus DSM 16100 = ATCC BAA-896 TaxID=1121022 RepID=V4PQL1_9CAUL|nr:CHAT domain-containing protein [Asticcacaulis benevestitus]ESQ87810.1 hypothetical protein ABENE_16795 [Asticcacaulis benevestitus DSM 16100 = ATCC BAA-896]
MADQPVHHLRLKLARSSAGWEMSNGPVTWPVTPAWPENSTLREIAWTIEEPEEAQRLAAFQESAQGKAASAGHALWASLFENAPDAIKQGVEGEGVSLNLEVSEGASTLALALLRSPAGRWAGLDLQSLTLSIAEVKSPLRLALKVLLITARPFDETDAPYLSVAHPLLAMAAKLGVNVTHLVSARQQSIRQCIEKAEAEGAPYTVLVFDGHGRSRTGVPAEIALETRLRRPAMVTANTFLSLLGKAPPPLILLAACRTASEPEATELASSFARDLAGLCACEAIGMNLNITPQAAGIFTVGMIEALHNGAAVAEAVQIARRCLSESLPSSFTWAAPVYFQSRQITFDSPPTTTLPAPPAGYIRDGECHAVDKTFDRYPVFVYAAPPQSGKTQFLSYYGWLRSVRSGDEVQPRLFDARQYAGPLALVEALGDPGLLWSGIVIVDNVEAWRDQSDETWQRFFEFVRARFSTGLRWLFAGRTVPIFPVALRASAYVQVLGGLGGAGARGRAELEAVRTYFFGPAGSDGPWQCMLIIAVRGHPCLLQWAGDAIKAGVGAENLLWSFVSPTPEVARDFFFSESELEVFGKADPLMGWGFGSDSRYVLAAVLLPEEPDESPKREECASGYLWKFSELGKHNLALTDGLSWLMAPNHAALLRALRPLDIWTETELDGFVDFQTHVRAYASISREEKYLTDRFRESTQGIEPTVNRDELSVSHLKMVWLAALLNLPACAAAAQIAVARGAVLAAAQIVSGVSLVLSEFDLLDCCEAWLTRWRPLMAELAQGGEAGQQARSIMSEEVLRIDTLVGHKYAPLEGRKLLDEFGTRYFDGSSVSIEEDVERIIILMESGEVVQDVSQQLTDIIQALSLVGPSGASAMPSISLIDRLDKIAERHSRRRDRVTIALIKATILVHLHDFAAAEEAVWRSDELADPNSTWEQFLVTSTAVEVFATTGGSRIEEMVQRALAAAQKMGNPLALGRAQLQVSMLLSSSGDMEGALSYCAEALPKLRGMSLYYNQGLLTYARLLSSVRDVSLAETYRLQAERAAESAPSSVLYLEALALGAIIAFQVGDSDRAKVATAKLREASENAGYEHGVGIARWVDAEFRYADRDYEGAYNEVTAALKQLRPANEGYVAHAWSLAANAAYHCGKYPEALDAKAHAADEFERYAVDPSELAEQIIELEILALELGSVEAADACRIRIRELCGERELRTPRQLAASAIYWAHHGDDEEARKRATQVLADTSTLEEELVARVRGLVKH